MKRAVVVGTGAAGSTVAKELQGSFDVTVLEQGSDFTPFQYDLKTLSAFRTTGLFFDEREIQLIFPAMKIRKTKLKTVLVNGIGLGGTTTIATGNGVRMDDDLKSLGIDLDEEFEEIYREIPVTTSHQRRWHPVTKELFAICTDMGLHPRPTPKMGEYNRCIRCGRCVFGCEQGVKWDARKFLSKARENGAALIDRCTVERVVLRDGVATGVMARRGMRSQFFPADLVVLAAGGFGTPVILEDSGIATEKRLFVDPVLCVAGPSTRASYQNEIPMPFVVQRDRYILSPYIDYLSYFFNRAWRHPLEGIISLMVKLADTPSGSISRSSVSLELTEVDRARLAEGVALCKEMLRRFGIHESALFLGTLNAGHPGGMLPLTSKEASSLHHSSLPENLFVADSTLFPDSLGNPPILTIIALAKRISKRCIKSFSSMTQN